MRAEEQPTACIAPDTTARAVAMKAETSQFRAAVWKKRKAAETGSDSEDEHDASWSGRAGPPPWGRRGARMATGKYGCHAMFRCAISTVPGFKAETLG